MPVAAVCAGSSPRVRGTPLERFLLGEHLRFIPACAGNSSVATRCEAMVAVHPRVCGELPEAAVVVERRRRFIPACAGNSRPGTPFTR